MDLAKDSRILVLGVGNTLRRDDGFGVHVVDALRSRSEEPALDTIALRDGGTLGLALLPEIEAADALIVVDAAEIGADPGEVRSFEGAAMDAQLGGRKRTVHEVAVAELLGSARLTGHFPSRAALIAVQPASTDWGLVPTAPVRSAIPLACDAVLALIERWRA